MNQDLKKRAAFLISALTSPFLIMPATVLLVAWRLAHGNTEKFLLWSTIALLFLVFVPSVYVLWEVKRHEITDLHIKIRSQRIKVFLVFLLSAVVNFWLYQSVEAPLGLMGLVLIAIGASFLALIITFFWKISIHTMALTGAMVAFATLAKAPWAWWILVMTMPTVAWARVIRKRHSVAQTIAGALVGGGLAYLVIAWFK